MTESQIIPVQIHIKNTKIPESISTGLMVAPHQGELVRYRNRLFMVYQIIHSIETLEIMVEEIEMLLKSEKGNTSHE